jgi:chromosome condensin MukBEF ATPase and DNA-binding subunit MukB
VVALVGAVFGGGGFWAWLGERRKATTSPPAAQTAADAEMVKAIGEFSQQFGEAAGGLLDHFRRELKFVRERVEACEARHEDCEIQVADLSRRLDESVRDRAGLREHLDRMMAEHPPAAYGPTLIAGLVPPRDPPTP